MKTANFYKLYASKHSGKVKFIIKYIKIIETGVFCLPGKNKLNIHNNENNDCEKLKSLADEYLHDELSDEEKEFIENHIKECADCADFITSEKLYLDGIKLAEYEPGISISQSVMKRITENKTVIEKPKKRRFAPFGLISAAVVVLFMFIATRGGPLDIFMQSNSDAAKSQENVNDKVLRENDNDINFEFGTAANFAIDGGGYGNATPGEEVGEEEHDDAIVEEFADISPAHASRIAIEVPDIQNDDSLIYESIISGNSDLKFEGTLEIYHTEYYTDFKTLKSDIFKNIEIYRTDADGKYDIVDVKYTEQLMGNLSENNSAFLYNADSVAERGDYILIMYK